MCRGKKSLDHDLATERVVTPKEASAGGANKMQAEREREGVITIELMLPIILQLISRVENVKAERRTSNKCCPRR